MHVKKILNNAKSLAITYSLEGLEGNILIVELLENIINVSIFNIQNEETYIIEVLSSITNSIQDIDEIIAYYLA